jgi:hypothetical protein
MTSSALVRDFLTAWEYRRAQVVVLEAVWCRTPGLTLRRYERPLAERRLPDGITRAAAAGAKPSPLAGPAGRPRARQVVSLGSGQSARLSCG